MALIKDGLWGIVNGTKTALAMNQDTSNKTVMSFQQSSKVSQDQSRQEENKNGWL